ncbi:MAG: iron ABC transporter permease [Anaerolineaceae bacterium]|nr:iron ABC transporter permease [Anaerolineaceae bacterium]
MDTSQPAIQGTPDRNRTRLQLLLLGGLMVAVFSISLFAGRYPRPGLMSFQTLLNDDLAQRLVLSLRLPRIITALLLGMSLSAAGNVFQMIFSNPLVEPGFLGVSQGASFGAALSIILLGGNTTALQGMALVFAFMGLGFSYLLARNIRFGGWVLRLVLSGIVVSALFSSGLGVLKYIADPLNQLPEITFWLLGGLSGVVWSDVRSIIVPVLLGLFIMYRMRWRLNLLSLDDEISFSLGLIPIYERTLLLAAAVTATAAIVSIAGMIGWVGLIIPHLARRMFGANARYTTPGAMLIGGTFAMLCDDIARTMLTGEIPLGILTSMTGAGLFILLMVTRAFKVRK